MRRLLALALCAAGLACTPSPNASPYGDVTGSVDDQNGNTFRFGNAAEGDTVQVTGPNCEGTAQRSALSIALSSRAGFCAGSQGNIALASNEVLLFTITSHPAASGGPAPAIAPGVYPIGAGIVDSSGNSYDVTGTFAIFSATCGQEDLFATGGSLQLDSLNAGEAIGEFTLQFGASDNSLSGSFDTRICPLTPAQLCATGGNTTCSP